MSLYTGFTEQKTCRIGGVTIGGLPGVNPALLVASVFYHGDELLLNEDEGLIDRENPYL